MTSLPTPLRMARAIALIQGWSAGLGVFVVLGVAVLAAGGLRNGAFVALALLFLAGDVLAVSVAVVIAARRLAEGAAWARLLLDVVEGVLVAVGLLAILMGSSVLGLGAVVLGTSVLICLHVPSSNALFAGRPLLPWETSRPRPPAPTFPVPDLPVRRRSRTAPRTASSWSAPAPSPQRPASLPAWKPPAAPAARAPRPPDLPSPAERTIPRIEPLPPLARSGAPRGTSSSAPAAEVSPALAAAPSPVRQPEPRPALPPPSTAPAPRERPSAAPPIWQPRELPPSVAAATATPAASRRGSATVDDRRSRSSARPARRSRLGMPPAPSWGWRKVVVAASLLGAAGGGVVSAVEIIANGPGRVPATGEAPAPQPPRSGALPGQALPAPARPGSEPARPRTERSEPAAAGGVTGVTVTPGGCTIGGSCTVTVRVDLASHPDTVVAWTLVVVDRCTGRHAETTVSGIPTPASYQFVLSTNQVTVPAWRSPQILAVTTSPARASSQPIVIGATGC